MFGIENEVRNIYKSFTAAHKNNLLHYGQWRKKSVYFSNVTQFYQYNLLLLLFHTK